MKMFCCYICKTKFTNRDECKKHMGIHSRIEPHSNKHSNTNTKDNRIINTDTELKVEIKDEPIEHEEGLSRFQVSSQHEICSEDINSGDAHQNIHNNNESNKCSYCEKSFARRNSLMKHQRTHTAEKPYQCNQCDKRFIYKRNLRKHKRIIHKSYQCDHCYVRFALKADMASHLKIHSGEKPFKPYQCNHCDQCFTIRNSLIQHLKTHFRNPYQCSQCDKRFIHRRKLKLHMREHTIVEPCQTDKELKKCSHCDELFTVRNCLIQLQRINPYEKPFQCSQCDERFTTKQNLSRHFIVHSLDESFVCKKCDFRTNSLDLLYEHHKDNSQDNIYKCNDCDLELKLLIATKRREAKIQKNNGIFLCKVCPLTFRRLNNLNKHVKIHSDNYNEENSEIHANNKQFGMNVKCISCKKYLKLKRLGDHTKVIDKRSSYELNSHLCELAYKHWGIRWDVNSKQRICLSCKLNLSYG